MKRIRLDVRLGVFAAGIALLCAGWVLLPASRTSSADETTVDETTADETTVVDLAPTSVKEARGRARLLHEVLGGSLQVMHRDFFDEENPPAIPSASLEDVFVELEKTHQVRVKWLTVETDVLNVDHMPQDAFEKDAVRALADGEDVYEAEQDGQFRFAGRIRLASQCLKCHVKTRTSTEPRTAGVVISMPLHKPR